MLCILGRILVFAVSANLNTIRRISTSSFVLSKPLASMRKTAQAAFGVQLCLEESVSLKYRQSRSYRIMYRLQPSAVCSRGFTEDDRENGRLDGRHYFSGLNGDSKICLNTVIWLIDRASRDQDTTLLLGGIQFANVIRPPPYNIWRRLILPSF